VSLKLPVPALTTVDPEISSARSMSELAYLLIRDRIITVKMAPGTVIEEKALSEQLELGRTPIREALSALANEHLVTAIPRRGRIVSEINLGDLRRIYEARVVCELPAVEMAAERASEAERSTAEGYMAEIDTLEGPAFDERNLMRLDYRCHAHIYRCTHNVFFQETLVRYLNLATRLWHFHMDTLVEVRAKQEHHPGVDELRALMRAIVAGDSQAAAVAATAHVRRSQHEILTPMLPSPTGSNVKT
jgi:DNA-binding GntR family transcriptional regulator